MSKDEEHLKLLSIFHYVVGGIAGFVACWLAIVGYVLPERNICNSLQVEGGVKLSIKGSYIIYNRGRPRFFLTLL